MTALHRLHRTLTAAMPLAGTRQLADGATAQELQLEAEYAFAAEQPIRGTYAYALLGITEVEDEDEESIAAWIRSRFRDDPLAVAALIALLFRYGRRAFNLGGQIGLNMLGVNATFNLTNPQVLDGILGYAESMASPDAGMSLTNTTAVETARRFARLREEGQATAEIVGGFGGYATARSLARAANVAETESVRQSRGGMLETYSRNEVREYIYFTRDDGLVCEICDPFHLARYNEEEYGRISGLIPQHSRCRCFWEPVTADWQPPENVWTGA